MLLGLTHEIHLLRRPSTAPAYWRQLYLRICRSNELHQTSTDTRLDRYPRIFAAARTYFGDRPDLNILSFGCSTGEEVLTLRRYFPSARITGAEINAQCLAACRRLAVDNRIAFIESNSRAIAARGPYDAIFCMAVLQRTPSWVAASGMRSLTRLYPFMKFESQLLEFDGWLADHGLLVCIHTPYRVTDTRLGDRYTPLAPPRKIGVYFDRDGNRQSGPLDCPLLIKTGAADA